jgi:hypothetical protein
VTEVISVVIALVSAFVAMLSAFWARSASRRGERALIASNVNVEHKEVESAIPGGPSMFDDAMSITVSLRNCGPSIAQDVATARVEPLGNGSERRQRLARRLGSKFPRLSHHLEPDWTRVVKSDKIRVMVPGETESNINLGTHFADGVLAVEVRWTDLSQRRWFTFQMQDPQSLTRAPRRLRKHWWEQWYQPSDW